MSKQQEKMAYRFFHAIPLDKYSIENNPMARIRTVKPQHWSDKELSNISLQAHLLWIGLWNFSDDEGVFENDAILIKSQIFPRRSDVRVEQVSQWLDQLAKARFVIPFTFNGTGYYIHRTFKTHQKIDKPQESKIPSDTIRRILDEHSDSDRPCIVEDSKVKVEERRGGEPEKISGDDFSKNNLLPKNQKEKKDISPGAEISIQYPFGEQFLTLWQQWKDFKKDQFKFQYKGLQSEQAALNELVRLSVGIEDNAIKIIHQSMANGWKGFFELKNTANGITKDKQPTGSGINSSSLVRRALAMPDKT